MAQFFVCNIRTSGGHFLTAVNQGGLGGLDYGPNAVALHSNQPNIGAFERFKVVVNGSDENLDFSQFSQGSPTADVNLITSGGSFVTAVDGGGLAGPNDATAPFHTDANVAGPWEQFWIAQLDPLAGGQIPDHVILIPNLALLFSNPFGFSQNMGFFITAVGGGGISTPSSPIITTELPSTGPAGPNETFFLICQGGSIDLPLPPFID